MTKNAKLNPQSSGNGNCCNSPTENDRGRECTSIPEAVQRREFLKAAGVGMVGSIVGGRRSVMAGGFSPEDVRANHLVPADKKLDSTWVKALFERGEKEVYRDKELDNIGMPCGGIGTGQLYLCGDGTLGAWQIFNHAESNWVGGTGSTYEHRGFAQPVDQGFAVKYRNGSEQQTVKTLNRDGFKQISFNGQYPIGTVKYEEDGTPIAVTMEAFSPFIPLNSEDSALPATLFHITVENRSDREIQASIQSWLENSVAIRSATQLPGKRVTRVEYRDGCGFVYHSAKEDPEALKKKPDQRSTVVYEDFESENYAKWTVEGTAFGSGPASGTLGGQQAVSGFEGKGLVNSFLGGDRPTGKMTSESFKIDRRFINLKVGGGLQKEKTCISLIVEGKTVRSATGSNTERLRWISWQVESLEGKEARFEIIDDASGGWGHINVDQIEFADKPRAGIDVPLPKAADFGTMVLVCADSVSPKKGRDAESVSNGTLVESGERVVNLDNKIVGRLNSREVRIAAGQKTTFSFVLAWHFPNAPKGHAYAVRFPNAEAVANYILENNDRLTNHTRLWKETFYNSTLPYWLLDRLHSTVSTLATGTCQWWADGRFYAYEGVTCCAGTCTHVWNYAHAHARLFPKMTRTIRTMQDLCLREKGGGFHPDTGLVGFRSNDSYAADGQCGTILKAYREHQMSPDDSFLKEFWPRIKKALQYSIDQDGNSDGLIENTQHNTYDINYEGANTFVGSLYLAALRAGEDMALEIGDSAFAKKCREIFESGSKLSQERLWNGEYFAQEVDLKKHTKHQYGNGCLSDHLFGQGWARQLGLGDIYPIEMVQTALKSIWKFNWAPDVTPYNDVHKPLRWFVSPGQAGLFTCTWPKSKYLPQGTVYKNEVWTGIEYQVAGHMIAEGMVEEGLAICRAVHDRYQPALINPYNEVECGDHYARAMASWGVFLALAGYEYHGPKGRLGFAPKITPENFKTAFTTADGWGTFEQIRENGRQIAQLNVAWGKVRLTSFSLDVPVQRQSISVKVDGKNIAVKSKESAGQVVLTFENDVTIEEGSSMTVACS